MKVMFDIEIQSIPKDVSQVFDVEASLDEVLTLFSGMREYAVEDASTFSARLRLQRIKDSIRLAGHASVQVVFECGRCLERKTLDVEAKLEYLLVPKSTWSASYEDKEELELGVEDLDMDFYEGEDLNVRPFIREALLLELQPFAVCPDSELALCEAARIRNLGAQVVEDNEEAGIDLRWSKLVDLKKKKEEIN